jgi:c-di-GMP phosphodiesterase
MAAPGHIPARGEAMADELPILLHPIADSGHGWAALALASVEPLDAERLTRLFGEQGLFEALGDLDCIVPLTELSVVDDIDSLLPVEKVLLSLPPAACRQDNWPQFRHLHELGFRLLAGADDARDCSHIDVVAVTPTTLAGTTNAGKPRRLAVGVDTLEAFDRCRTAGCDWFAGNYPLTADPARLPRNGTRQALLMQLLTLITREADSHDIEQLIKQDAHLSYQLLRLVNSVAFSLTREISSFGQAITLLGRRQLQRWLQLLLYARKDGDVARSPLLPRAALRAALMEALAQQLGHPAPEQAYMVGMFSLLDRLLGGAMTDILTPLHLPTEVNAALIAREGPLGKCLATVEAADGGDCAIIGRHLDGLGLTAEAWTAALIRSYRWAIQVSGEA